MDKYTIYECTCDLTDKSQLINGVTINKTSI